MTGKICREGDVVDLAVDGVDDEGRGRGVMADLDVAIRGALPGDTVRCRIERTFPARKLAQARALAILRPGPLHVERDCPHVAPCPGCPLEGAESGFVHAIQRGRIEQALADVGLECSVDDVVPSRAPRQKVKLTAGGRSGALRLGMFVPHSHVLVGAEGCPHQHEAIRAALAALQPALHETGIPPALLDPRGIKAVIARAFQEGVGMVVVVGAPISGEAWRVLGAVVDGSPIASLAVRVDETGGNSLVGGSVQRFVGPQALTPLEASGPDVVPETVDAFCQTDPALAAWLYAQAASFLVERAPADARYADLYAGTGGFSRALLAAGARHIVAVERTGASAASLRALPVEALLLAVEEALENLAQRPPFAGLVLDPPKAGLREAAAPLARLGATRVALVACDPDAGARDARVFVDAGYSLTSVTPVELFPATPEVETLFLLEKR